MTQPNRLVVDGRPTTWAELSASGPLAAAPLAVLEDGHQAAFRAVARHADRQPDASELLIATAGRVDAELRAGLSADGFHLVTPAGVVEPAETREPEAGRIWILTSGSTGRPKRVPHTLTSLTTVGGEQPPRVWLCPYSPGTYAWWQVVTLSLTVPGQGVVTIDQAQLDTWPAVAAEHGVTAVSGTPTFWRQTLLRSGDELAALPLAQVTLGGEPVDQAILDRLREVLPAARISWIYASSEVGAAIAVHDGRAGFPVAWLDRSGSTDSEHNDAKQSRPTLSIDDDELVIVSPHAGAGFDGRVRTGDRVEIADDRVLITGRRDSDEINVGGSKVSAGMVRNTLLTHDAVRWVRVFGRNAPLVGRVVAAEIVTDGTVTEADLMKWAQTRLAEYAMPRRIRLLDEIPMKETLKSDV